MAGKPLVLLAVLVSCQWVIDMCGIFGIVSKQPIHRTKLDLLALRSERRGKDSSGLVKIADGECVVVRSDQRLTTLRRTFPIGTSRLVFGHSRLVTNGTKDNQPVVRDGIVVVHNGIVVNHAEIWPILGAEPHLDVDTEVIAAIIASHLSQGGDLSKAADKVFELCDGVISCLCLIPAQGKLLAFSNNGSLFKGALTVMSFLLPRQKRFTKLGAGM